MKETTAAAIITTVVTICFVICVTVAAISFGNAWILLWYILALFMMITTSDGKKAKKEA